jgi:hypothetical protein
MLIATTIMKFHLLVAVAALLGFDHHHQVSAWAPSLSSVATRAAPKISRSHGYASSPFKLYVLKGDVEVDAKTAAAFQEPAKTQILGQPIPYSELTIGVLKETFKGENRVSQTPDSIRTLVKAGMTVLVQSGGT